MKMKLMAAIALSHHAELIILDEPTSGLDPVARDELLDILAEYIEDENCGVLFSSHITADVERIADYVTVLQEGSVWYTGTKDDADWEYFCYNTNPFAFKSVDAQSAVLQPPIVYWELES